MCVINFSSPLLSFLSLSHIDTETCRDAYYHYHYHHLFISSSHTIYLPLQLLLSLSPSLTLSLSLFLSISLSFTLPLSLLQTWDTKAGNVWFVGDSIDDMVCGKLAGCKTCLILTNDNEKVALQSEYVDISVKTLTDFAKHIGLSI